MKKTLLLAGTLLSIFQAQAQHNFFKHRQSRSKDREFIGKILNAQSSSNSGLKPTGTQQRVIAQVNDYIIENELDSTVYKYTGTRGSKFNYNTFGYDLELTDIYDPVFSYNAEYTHFVTGSQADTLLSFYDGEMANVYAAHHRADNKIDTLYEGEELNNYDRKSINIFNNNGHVTDNIRWNNGDTASRQKLAYNTDFTKVTADTTWQKISGSWNNAPPSTIKYTYNANGKIESVTLNEINLSTLQPLEKYTYTYYPDQKIQTILRERYVTNSTTQKLSLDSFGYQAGIDYATLWDNYSYYTDQDNVEHRGGERMMKHVGANGMPDTILVAGQDNDNEPWENYVQLSIQYNSFNNPETAQGFLIENGTISVLAASFRYYYETYEDVVLSIPGIANNKDFSVYPNPFSNNIFIYWKGKQQNNIHIRLTDILGHEVFKTTVKLNAGNNALTLPSLKSGDYILLLQDADGKSWSNKLVRK